MKTFHRQLEEVDRREEIRQRGLEQPQQVPYTLREKINIAGGILLGAFFPLGILYGCLRCDVDLTTAYAAGIALGSPLTAGNIKHGFATADEMREKRILATMPRPLKRRC